MGITSNLPAYADARPALCFFKTWCSRADGWAEVGRLLSREPPGYKGEPRFVTYGRRTLSVSAWARELGWTRQALSYRIAVMPLERALTPRMK